MDFDAFVKVMPHEYRAALESEMVSASGDGFFTRETEEAAA